MTDNEDLRTLFADAAADIRPHGTLEEIQARSATRPRTTWLMPAVAAAVVVGLVVGGIGWTLHDTGSSARHTGPAGTVHQAPTTRTAAVYYVGDTASGPRLFPEQTRLATPDGNVAGFGMQAAKLAVSGASHDPDYRSPWPAGTTIQGLGGCDGACDIQVTFAGTKIAQRPAGMSEATARLAIEQLVRTVQAATGYHDPVFFESYTASNNKTDRLNSVLGIDTSSSMTGTDAALLAPVQIQSPTNGETVKAGKVTVSGLASTFEANVVWEVLVGGDAVVKQGFTTAASCCTLSPYSFTVDLTPGTYTIVVHDTDMSGQGRPVNQDTKEIIVQ